MSKFIGRLVDVGFALETTRGTAESSATYWIPKMSLSLDDKIEQVIDESSYGVIEDSPDAKIVKKFAEGELEGKIGASSIGLILKSVLGSVSTTGPTDNAYVHTYSLDQTAQHSSMTIFQDDPNQDYTYPLGMVSSFGLDVSLGAYSKFTLGFRSKKGATGTHSPSYSAEDNFLPQHGVLTIADTQGDLDSTGTDVDIRSVQLNIEKNIEDDDIIGSTDQADILNKQFSCEGTLELVFDEQTFKTELLADTQKAVRIKLENTDATIGVGSTNPKLEIDLHKVKFSEFTRNFGNDDVVTATVNFKAFYNTTDSKMITVELTNGVSSY